MSTLYRLPLFLIILINIQSPLLITASPENIVRNFQQFSEQLLALSADSAEATDTKPGLKLYNPFGIGYLLANLNEQLWNISNKGVPEALQTHSKYVSEDYGYLLGLFKKSKFQITSTVYSRYGNVSKTQGLSRLLTHLIKLDFVEKPAEFVDSFSNILDIATKGHLENELLPKALWQNVFENSTQGALLNTMHYKSKWAKPWADIGERSFNYDTIVQFIETEGEFPVFQNENMTAIIIPVQSEPSQQMVFIKPHINLPMDHLRHEIKNLLATNSSWSLKKLRVQIPAINATNLSRHNLGFSLMGVNETFCQSINESSSDYTSTQANFVQQPIAQASHFEFAPTYIEFASGTGSSVSLPHDLGIETGLDEEYEDDYTVTKDGNDPDEGDPISFEQSLGGKYQRTMNDVLESDRKCEKPDEFSKSHRISQSVIHDADGKATLIFDTPFTWILRDVNIGETFSGSVSSLCQYKKVGEAIKTSSAHAWLHDVFKVAFWKCL